jgi:hypothetical protein
LRLEIFIVSFKYNDIPSEETIGHCQNRLENKTNQTEMCKSDSKAEKEKFETLKKSYTNIIFKLQTQNGVIRLSFIVINMSEVSIIIKI